MEQDKQEYLPLVDEEGNFTGRELRSVCHNGKSMLLHPVVHLHIFNEEGWLYLQKRPMHKDVQPGKWDTSVGGHVDPGETIAEALAREAMEEMGMEAKNAVMVKKYIWESAVERELVHSHYMVTGVVPTPDPEEVEQGRFWSPDEIERNIGKGVFTENFEIEFNMIRDIWGKR